MTKFAIIFDRLQLHYYQRQRKFVNHVATCSNVQLQYYLLIQNFCLVSYEDTTSRLEAYFAHLNVT